MKKNKPAIDPALVREIANLLSESDLTEIEVQHEICASVSCASRRP